MILIEDPLEIDGLLNQILPLSRSDFIKIAIEYTPDDLVYMAEHNLLRWLRRRVVRRTDYTGPVKRKRRDGYAWSWCEEQVLKYAFSRRDSETPEGVEITEDYIANLLQRSIIEVQEKRKTKNGIRGFDL